MQRDVGCGEKSVRREWRKARKGFEHVVYAISVHWMTYWADESVHDVQDTALQTKDDQTPVPGGFFVGLAPVEFIGPDDKDIGLDWTESYAGRLSLECYGLEEFGLQHG